MRRSVNKEVVANRLKVYFNIFPEEKCETTHKAVGTTSARGE